MQIKNPFRRRIPMQKPVENPQPKPQPDNECDIKVKRDAHGRVVGIRTRGKCTKEDKLMFLRENNIENMGED